MISAFKKADPPPHRVKPIPIKVIRSIAGVARFSQCVFSIAIADMIIVAFFFLLRPGEYTASPSDTQPFDFQSVQLFVGHRSLNLLFATDAELLEARFATLTFDHQKNGVRGEVIGLGCSDDPYLCPVKALARRVIHLRTHNATPTTPLALVYQENRWRSIKPADLTSTLRNHVSILGPSLGFRPKDVSVRSLRVAGANALLTAHVDTDIIRIIGRWRSDEMLRYLHVQNGSLMAGYSRLMLTTGDYNLIPNQLAHMHKLNSYCPFPPFPPFYMVCGGIGMPHIKM